MGLLDDFFDPNQFQDIGQSLGAGFQGWAQTPAGSPFAGLANGINAFNNAQAPGGTDGSLIGPPVPAQTPDFSSRLGAGLQSWAQTPAGSPFAALANGVTGFNTGQTIAPSTPTPAKAQPSADGDQTNAAPQAQIAPATNAAMSQPAIRRLAVMRKWPLWSPR
jgi:hypothetical protein